MKKQKLLKTHLLRVRISKYEAVKVSHHAAKHGKTVSQIVREYIRRLPAIKMRFEEFAEYFEETTGREIDETKFNIPLLNSLELTLEDWLKMVETSNELPLDEWSEIAGW